jgi:hypothetical protein
MSLKRTLLLLGLVLTLLLPVGLILKNQNPWTCFAFTLDENFYAQAAMNWSEGRGYRMSDHAKPYEPVITAGVPMAWGSTIVKDLTGEDIALSGRIFVYACFILLLLAIARNAYIGRFWLAVPFALGIFGYGLSKTPFGGYFAFGFLGEAPALLLGALAFGSLDRRRFLLAGFLAAATFLVKPTFLFFPIAVVLGTLVGDRRGTLKVLLATAVTLGGGLYAMASARGEAIDDYLRLFYETSHRVSSDVGPGTLIDFYNGLPPVVLYLSGAFVVVAVLFLIYGRRPWRTSVGASTFLFVFAAAYFLAVGRRPVEKQWAAIFTLTLVGMSAAWAGGFAARLSGWIPSEMTRAITLSVIATWVFVMGQQANHAWKRMPEDSCGAKEQIAINRTLRKLADDGTIRADNVGLVVADHPYSTMLYRLRWIPKTADHRPPAGETWPEWTAGQNTALFPLPAGCETYWKGLSFSILRCASAAPAPEAAPVAAPPKESGRPARNHPAVRSAPARSPRK